MKRVLVVLCAAAGLTLSIPGGLSARAVTHTKVVCIDENTFNREYKFKPRHCIFHRRHSPKAEAFFVRTKHDHWRVWGNRHARGRGKAIASMSGPTPVKIRLFDPVEKCGHRVFSRAHFRFPEFDSGGTMKLDTCA